MFTVMIRKDSANLIPRQVESLEDAKAAAKELGIACESILDDVGAVVWVPPVTLDELPELPDKPEKPDWPDKPTRPDKPGAKPPDPDIDKIVDAEFADYSEKEALKEEKKAAKRGR